MSLCKLWTYRWSIITIYTMCTLQDMDLNQELNQSVTDGRTRVTLYVMSIYVTGPKNTWNLPHHFLKMRVFWHPCRAVQWYNLPLCNSPVLEVVHHCGTGYHCRHGTTTCRMYFYGCSLSQASETHPHMYLHCSYILLQWVSENERDNKACDVHFWYTVDLHNYITQFIYHP